MWPYKRSFTVQISVLRKRVLDCVFQFHLTSKDGTKSPQMHIQKHLQCEPHRGQRTEGISEAYAKLKCSHGYMQSKLKLQVIRIISI